MNVPAKSSFLLLAFLFAASARAQTPRREFTLAPNVPPLSDYPQLADDKPLSPFTEWGLRHEFATHRKRDVLSFNFEIGSFRTTLYAQPEVVRLSLDSDRWFAIRSGKPIYKFEPRHWPRNLSDFADKAFIRPAREIFEKSMNAIENRLSF